MGRLKQSVHKIFKNYLLTKKADGIHKGRQLEACPLALRDTVPSVQMTVRKTFLLSFCWQSYSVLWVELCPLKRICKETPGTLECYLGNGAFIEVIKLKWAIKIGPNPV